MQTTWDVSSKDQGSCDEFRKALNISSLSAHLLLRRDISTVEEARQFLFCDISSLHDPFLLKDMGRAVERVLAALNKKESILIYGDYDADGLTATALLFSALKRHSDNVLYYIPDRLKEGYGLNIEALKKVCKDGVSLVIAVDCGITAVEEIAYLNRRGIDCVIIDHHQPLKDGFPAACGIINPLRPDCEYPCKHLAGVGLVYKLTQALRMRFGARLSGKLADGDDLDLVALGTIADVAPLRGENRIFVRHGLKRLAVTKRAGLRALIEVSGLGKKEEFHTDTVGFILGPRINASGRVSSSSHSLRLLLTEDAQEAASLADGLDKDNRQRQRMEEKILREAVLSVEREINFKEHKAIVIASDGWHPGVIGIVASRIVEKFYRPTILIAFKDDIGKGSGRSIRNFHLFDALSKCKEHLIGYGGHKHAAGITITKEKLEIFRDHFNIVASHALQPLDLVPRLDIDAEISLKDITPDFIKELKSFEPFGMGNSKPVFSARNLSLKARPKILNSNTLKIWVTDGSFTYEAVGFKKAFDFKIDPAPHSFSLAFTPSVNTWQGQETIQLVIKDLQI